jgi:hypothetical protein
LCGRPGVGGITPGPGAQGAEDRIEPCHGCSRAADHHAVPSLESPDTSARPDVDVLQALRLELFRATDVVDVVGVSAVDEDVAGGELRRDVAEHAIDGTGRNHDPDGAWLLEQRDKFVQ